jgi:hypothetical protein
MAQDYDINLKVKGLGAAANQLAQFTGALGEAAEEGEAATGVLDQMTGGALSGFKKAVGGIKTFIKSLGLVRGAVLATGVGALVIAIGSLVTLFTKTQRGAERMERASAMLGAVFGEIVDLAAQIGDFLYEAFTTPGKALDALNNAVVGAGNFLLDMLKIGVYPLRKGLLLLKKATLEAAISTKEFFGGDTGSLQDMLATTTEAISDLEQGATESLQNLSAPFEAVARSVETFTRNVKESVTAADNLTRRAIALRQAQRDLSVEMATARKDIKAYNLIAEDTTKGFEERMEAADKAIALEQKLMADRKALAKEELAIHQQNMDLSESTEDDLQREAELKAAVATLEMESLELQTTLNNKRNTINQQRIAQEEKLTAFQKEMARERMKEYAKAEAGIKDQLDQRIRDIDKLIIAEEEKESLRVQARASSDAQLEKLQLEHQQKVDAMSAQFATEQMGARQQQEAAIQQELEQRYIAIEQLAATEEERERLRIEAREASNAKMLKLQQTFQQEDLALVQAGATATFDLLRVFANKLENDSEGAKKKAFERNKRIGIAETLVSTYMAAQKAYTSQLTATPDSPIRAVIAAAAATASGLARVAAIKSTQYSGGGSGGSADGGGGGIGGGTQSVGVDVGSLIPNQQTPTPEPVRAYVVENEISNKQALNRELQIQTTL